MNPALYEGQIKFIRFVNDDSSREKQFLLMMETTLRCTAFVSTASRYGEYLMKYRGKQFVTL